MHHPIPVSALTDGATPSGRAWRSRLLAAAVITALAAACGALAAVPASAATVQNVTGATLDWGVSVASQTWGTTTTGEDLSLNEPTSKTGPGGGVYTGSNGFTLSAGTGALAADGTGTIAYPDASVTYSPFAGYGTLTSARPTVTLADFDLVVDSATRGHLVADLTWYRTADSALTSPARVTVANFDISALSVTDGALELQTAAPDWTDVVPVGTYAAGYADSWPTSFVDALVPGSGQDPSVYFFRTGVTTGNTNKAPLALSAAGDVTSVTTPDVTAAVTYPTTGGADVAVSGSDFSGLNQGVYLAVGPAGLDLSKTSDAAYADAFLDATWIPDASLGAGNTASATLHVDTADLSPTGDYAVYSWNAHAHATTADDTVTPITVDYASLADAPVSTSTPTPTTEPTTEPTPAPTAEPTATTTPVPAAVPTTVVLKLAKPKAVYGRTLALTARLGTGATGTVVFATGKKTLGSAPVKNGVAKLAVTKKLSVGTHKVTASYSGDATHAASTSSVGSVKIMKTSPSVSASAAKIAAGTKPVLKVKLSGTATGKVTAFVTGTKVGSVRITAKSPNVVPVKLTKKFAKTATVTLRYAGSATAHADRGAVTVRVAK